MKARDLTLAAAVVVIAGVAVADSLRSDGNGEASQRANDGRGSDGSPSQPQQGPPPGWRRGLLSGTLVFTDSKDCRIRVIGLSSGRERSLRPLTGTCQMWAAGTSELLAYARGPAFSESETFTFIDLFRMFGDFGTFTPSGPILWSPDGERAAWCDPDGGGLEMNIPANSIGTLRGCPVAYTTDGEPAHVDGDLVTVGGRTVLNTTGTITHAHWGTDGSVAVVVQGRWLERWEGRTLVHRLELPGRLEAPPVFGPDNCAVILALTNQAGLELADLGCFPDDITRADLFFGTTATWSPDGEWVAVAEGRNSSQITFVRVVGGNDDVLRWDAGAVQLLWRGPRAS